MQKWEYKTVLRKRAIHVFGGVDEWDIDITPLLAELGNDGWELVAVTNRSDQIANWAGTTTSESWVFKRPAINEIPPPVPKN